jgi:hypothetical protein
VVAPSVLLLGKSADDFSGDVEEENGCDEGERKNEDDEGVTVKTITALLASMTDGVKTREKKRW